jgi:hypothetical protein
VKIMHRNIVQRTRWPAVALVACVIGAAVPAGAASSGGGGPESNGLVRLARYAACAGGVFYGFSYGGAVAIDQALAFCAQLLSLEEA